MVPLNQEARREGRIAMEKSLTTAGRIRRRLKAGRPRTVPVLNDITALQAVSRLVTERDKAQNLMREAGLDPNDVKYALVFYRPGISGYEYNELPARGETSDCLKWFEDLAKTTTVLFLGILWFQADHEAKAKGEPWQFTWLTPFVGGPEAEKRLLAAKDLFLRGGNKTLGN